MRHFAQILAIRLLFYDHFAWSAQKARINDYYFRTDLALGPLQIWRLFLYHFNAQDIYVFRTCKKLHSALNKIRTSFPLALEIGISAATICHSFRSPQAHCSSHSATTTEPKNRLRHLFPLSAWEWFTKKGPPPLLLEPLQEHNQWTYY